MSDEDEQPTEEERREAAALAEALEGAPAGDAAARDRKSTSDALETAALLRHARDPIAVPPALEPRVMAQVAETLEARRRRRPRRARSWIALSLGVPALAAVLFASFVSMRSTDYRGGPRIASLPPPPADLLAAQAQATRGGGQAGAALARLDVEMRAYRHRYHEELRRRLGSEP